MKKTILNISLILALAGTSSVFAQQGIGTNNPDKSAALEIASTNKGLLIPRMNLTWVSNAINAPIATPAKGLLVYNSTSISNVPEGFYYFDGTKWVPIGTTVLQDSNTTTISGNGTASNPYKVEVKDLAGDVTGSILTNKVEKIQNFPVSATAPTTGQVLKEVGGVWTPSTLTTTDVSDSKALTTTSPLKVNAANSEANAVLADVNLSVEKATASSLGVVQVGSNINVDANGVISVNFPTATVDTNTTTTVSTDQSYVTVDKTQTVGLEADALNTRDYKIGVNKATATSLGVVMPGTGMNVDTDGKLNVTLDGSETKLVAGTNTTVSGTGTTADAYKVNVATANSTELGVVKEAATNPTVNVNNGVLAVNLSNTTLSGEVTGPLNATVVANDVIDAANLKTDAVTTVKIVDENVTPVKIKGGTEGQVLTTNSLGKAIWAAPVADVVTTLTGTLATGNNIGTYKNEAGTDVVLNETVTTLTGVNATGNNIGTYKNESGTDVVLNETVTTLTGVNATGNNIGTYKNESGTDVVINETVTTLTGVKATGNNIGTYKNESGTDVVLNETITSLTQNASGISYSPESGSAQTAKVVSADATNLVTTGTDFGALFTKTALQNNQVKYEVISGTNTTASLDPSSTTDLQKYKVDVTFPAAPDGSETKLAAGTNTTVTGTGTTADAYKVNVATANGTTLGVVQEAATNPTVNVNNGVLAVNLSNTTLSGEVTGPLNATVVANDVIDAANLKTDAVTTVKIVDENVTPVKIKGGTVGQVLTTDSAGKAIWAAPVADVVTTLTGTLATGNNIGTYKNESGTDVVLNETITSLTQTADGISYAPESGSAQTAKVVSADATNLVTTGTDFGALFTKTALQNNQVKYEVISGTNTTATLDPSSTADLQKYKVDVTFPAAPDGSETKLAAGTNTTVTGTGTTADAYKVNVATANGTTLGVVQEAATNPTVNVNNGVLAVNLSNTTLSGEVTGPLNATEVANDVIDAANLKTDAVTTVKIANNTILGEDLNVNVAGNGLSQANNGALQINASNGLTVDATNDVVQLGGNLTKTTTITQNGNPFNIVTAGTALTISGLPNTASTQYNAENGVGSDRIVVADTNGLLKEMKAAMPKFFYAPSIALPTAPDQIVVGSGITESSGVYTVQLHTIYSNQFGGTFTTGVSNTGKVSNTNRTTVLPTLAAIDLDYYITFFDTSVFSDVTISNVGVMTYKIKTTADVTIGSFMNIVFVVKP